jgi:hypothetical protein
MKENCFLVCIVVFSRRNVPKFRGKCCVHLYNTNLNMKIEVSYSEAFVNLYQTTRSHIPDLHNPPVMTLHLTTEYLIQ